MEALEKIKKVEYEILIEFDRICNELGIKYSLTYGTLIGAKRHGGFIPWDDDIDVMMLREDYDIFISKGKQLMKKKYFLQTYETDRNYLGNFAKIRDEETNLVEYNTQKLNAKTGIYIDIFPIDKVSNNIFIRNIDLLIYSIILCIKNSSTIELAKNSNSKMKRFMHILLFPLANIIGVQRLNKLETYIKSKNNIDKNNKVYVMDPRPFEFKNNLIFSVEALHKYEKIMFEGREFYTIKDNDLFLRKCYGDYMKLPSIEERKSNHNFIKVEFKV